MTTGPTIVGIDLGKNWFHLIGLDADGATVLRRKLNRSQLAAYAVTAPTCVVVTEACPGSQYWGRVFTKAGHTVRILPAQFVKPYLKATTNDFNDAEAIAEAGGRAHMRDVPLKTTEQLELQALHRVRRRFITERTAVINQMRALLLEHGIVIPLGRALFARRLPAIFEDAENALTSRLVVILHRLRQRWLAIDVESAQATQDLTDWAEQSALCRRATTVPGIGPVIATAVGAAVGDGRMFARGRDMAADGNDGDNVPFGQGNTPIRTVLQTIRDNKWPIDAIIEFEYKVPGVDPMAEMSKCVEYCRKALEG